MTGGETSAHRELKALAFAWARANGLPIAGCEVRVPKSGYRADVAAASRNAASETGRVALFECKQARSDFLRDEADEPAIREEAAALAVRLGELRSLIAAHRPDLRRGESLFAEFDAYDLAGLRHDTFHALEREFLTLQRKLHACVKFARLHRYCAADYLYLVSEPDILSPHEIPSGWGWLVRQGAALELRQPPERHACQSTTRLSWLEAIAAAGSRVQARRLHEQTGLCPILPPGALPPGRADATSSRLPQVSGVT